MECNQTVLTLEHNEHLAYMECFTSCVMTYLKLIGRDPRALLLDYWNVNYERRTLLSNKHASDFPLDYLYGLKMELIKGDLSKLSRVVQDGGAAIVLCAASKLEYFPRNYLGMEASGFSHAILIAGWDEPSQSYDVADPVVNTVTRLSPNQIVNASAARADRGELQMFTLRQKDGSFVPPTRESVLSYCAQRIVKAYAGDLVQTKPEKHTSGQSVNANKWEAWQQWFRLRNSGLMAWSKFEQDLSESAQWAEVKRASWIKQNMKMILSIKTLRAKIWSTYHEFGQFRAEQLKAGDEQIETIVQAWNTLNLYLVKYGSKSYRDGGIAVEVLGKMEKVKSLELHFLEWLNVAVREGDSAYAARTTS